MRFFLSWVATAIAAAVAFVLVPGIYVANTSTFVPVVVFALFLALINVSIKPILQFLGAPISFMTLGLFYLMINAALVLLAAWLSNVFFGAGIVVNSWFSALFAALIISIVSTIANAMLGTNNQVR